MQGGSSKKERFIGPDGVVKERYGGPKAEEPKRRDRKDKKPKLLKGRVVNVVDIGHQGAKAERRSQSQVAQPSEGGSSSFGYLARKVLRHNESRR